MFLLLLLLVFPLSCLCDSPSNCSSISIDLLRPLPYGCPLQRCVLDLDVSPIQCRIRTSCDVALNYSLELPYGCPRTLCDLKSRSTDGMVEEYCGPISFASVFENLYWGRNGMYPFGYLFWNVLVALIVILYLQFMPRVSGLLFTKVLNGVVLNKEKELAKIKGVSLMVIGGRGVCYGLEYLSPNVHVKCLEVSVHVKWWRGSNDIRQSPSTTLGNVTSVTVKARKLPFRMSIFFTGLEISVYNNTGKYQVVEQYVLETLYKTLYHKEPPVAVPVVVPTVDLKADAVATPDTSVVGSEDTRIKQSPSWFSRLCCVCFSLFRCCSRLKCRTCGRANVDDARASPKTNGSDDEDEYDQVEPENNTSAKVSRLYSSFLPQTTNYTDGATSATITTTESILPTSPLPDNDAVDRRSASRSSIRGKRRQKYAFVDPLPRAYWLFPITRLQCNEFVLYIGAPTLSTTLVVHVERAVAVHFTEPIPNDALNYDLDSYRIVNKADLRNVVVSMRPNPGFVAMDEMRLIRTRMEKQPVEAREVLNEIFRNVKSTFQEVKIGMNDVRSDIGQSLGVSTQDSSKAPTVVAHDGVTNAPLGALGGGASNVGDKPNALNATATTTQSASTPVVGGGNITTATGATATSTGLQNTIPEASPVDMLFHSVRSLTLRNRPRADSDKNQESPRNGLLSAADDDEEGDDEDDDVHASYSLRNKAGMGGDGGSGGGGGNGGGGNGGSNAKKVFGTIENSSRRGTWFSSFWPIARRASSGSTNKNRRLSKESSQVVSENEYDNNNATLLRSRMERQQAPKYSNAVRGYLRRNKKGPRSLPEPDVLRTGKVEVAFVFDSPGRVRPEHVNLISSSPKQSMTFILGGGDADDETILTYGPWNDRQRALFQEHFTPFAFATQKPYAPNVMGIREPTKLDVKIVFSRFAEIRFPHREQDLGLLMTGKRNQSWGCGDSGTNEDSGFWFELSCKLNELKEEQRKRDDVEDTKIDTMRRAMLRKRAVQENMAKRRAEGEGSTLACLRQLARDGWLPVSASKTQDVLDMDVFVDYCDIDVDDLNDVSALVDVFNAMSAYQTALLEAVPELDSDLVNVPGSSMWQAEEKARFLWGEYSGREVLMLEDNRRLRSLDPSNTVTRHQQRLFRRASALNVANAPLHDLEMCVKKLNAVVEHRVSSFHVDVNPFGPFKHDPRRFLGKWFSADSLGTNTERRMTASDSLTDLNATASHEGFFQSTQPGGCAAESLPPHLHGDCEPPPFGDYGPTKRTATTLSSYVGPITNAEAWNTSCGWVQVSVQAGSSIVVDMPYYALDEMGCTLRVDVDFRKPKLYVSATHCTVSEAASVNIALAIDYPVIWNAEQAWKVNASFQAPRVRMLKTDVQSLIKLGADWSSNSIEYSSVAFFIPTSYDASMTFTNAEILFNVNENNVVDLPEESIDHNTYVSLTIPNGDMMIRSENLHFQPVKSHVDLSISWEGDPVFHLPIRATLILPATHPRRAVSVSATGFLGQGPGGAACMPDPVFVELEEYQMDFSYTYHQKIGENLIDVMDVKMNFDNFRMTGYAESMTAMMRVQENYFGQNMFHIGQDAYRTFNAQNFKTLLAFRNWFEIPGSGARKTIVENDYELHVRATYTNSLLFFPIALYPRVTQDGVIRSPEEDAVTLFCRDVVLETRMRNEQFAEYSFDASPVRLQVPGSSNKRNDPVAFSESFMSNLNRSFIPSGSTSATSSVPSGDAFARLWLRGGMNASPAGFEVGQLVLNGSRFEQQCSYGRAHRDSLAPLVAYRSNTKISMGALWGDLEIFQIAQIKDAMSTFELQIARLKSFDRFMGGTRDPCLNPCLPLGELEIPNDDRLRRKRSSVDSVSEDVDAAAATIDFRRRKSSLSLFTTDFDGYFGGPVDAAAAAAEASEASEHQDSISRAFSRDDFDTSDLSGGDGNKNSLESDDEPSYFFLRVEIQGAKNLPSMHTHLQINANACCEVSYGSQGFKTNVVPDASNPIWNLGYTLLASSAPHLSDVQDLNICMFDASFGIKQKIGTIVVPAGAVRRACLSDVSQPPSWCTLDSNGAHYSLRARARGLSSRQQQQQPSYIIMPFMGIQGEGNGLAQLSFSIRPFSLTRSQVNRLTTMDRPKRRFDRVYESASVNWNRDPLPKRGSFSTFYNHGDGGPLMAFPGDGEGTSGSSFMMGGGADDMDESQFLQPGALTLDPRVVASREWKQVFILNAAKHLLQTEAMTLVASHYAHDTVVFSSGPVAVNAWSHLGDSFVEFTVSECKFRGENACNSKYSKKLSSDGRNNVTVSMKHLKRANAIKASANGAHAWALVGSFALQFDLRTFWTRKEVANEVKKQSLFIEAHDFAKTVRTSHDALIGLRSKHHIVANAQHQNLPLVHPLESISASLAEELSRMPNVKTGAVAGTFVQPATNLSSIRSMSKSSAHSIGGGACSIRANRSTDDGDKQPPFTERSVTASSMEDFESAMSTDDDEVGEEIASLIYSQGKSDDMSSDSFDSFNDEETHSAPSSFQEGGKFPSIPSPLIGVVAETLEDEDITYVASRYATLPMEGPCDPYGSSTASLEPFLEMYSVERYEETNDYWFGSAFGWSSMSGLGGGGAASTGTHQTREMAIAPSARTEARRFRGPEIPIVFATPIGLAFTCVSPKALSGVFRGDFSPVLPGGAIARENAKLSSVLFETPEESSLSASTMDATSNALRVDNDDPDMESFFIRIHVVQEIEAFLTPATVAFAEDALHRWFSVAPSVNQMVDYFERNYLVLPPSPPSAISSNRLISRTVQTKWLVTFGSGLSVSLLHGSKIDLSAGTTVGDATSSPYHIPLPIAPPHGTEIVYATRFKTGPVTIGRRIVKTLNLISYEGTTIDVPEAQLTIQIASAFAAAASLSPASSRLSPASQGVSFPVFKLSVSETLLVRTVELEPIKDHQHFSMTASCRKLDLLSGVDSVYVSYSAGLTWGDLISGFSREGMAIAQRQKRQWAILAGQLLILSKRMDDIDMKGTGEKEPRLGLALMAWCMSESPSSTMNLNKLSSRAKFSNSPFTTSVSGVPTAVAVPVSSGLSNATSTGIGNEPASLPGANAQATGVTNAASAAASSKDDMVLQIPRAGWSTLIRARRIACFLSEYTGTELRMREVQIDRYASINPVTLDVVSGARVLFPEFYSSSSVPPHTPRHHISGGIARAAPSKDLCLSRVLVRELLTGVTNRGEIRAKHHRKVSKSFDARMDGLNVRIVDAKLREVKPPQKNVFGIPAIAMRPATALCMFIHIKASFFSADYVETHASRTSIVLNETIRGNSMGFSCTTSPELILASRAGATVMNHYTRVLRVRVMERKAAAEAHKKEILQSIKMSSLNAAAAGGPRARDAEMYSTTTTGGVLGGSLGVGALAAGGINHFGSSMKSDMFMSRRTNLDAMRDSLSRQNQSGPAKPRPSLTPNDRFSPDRSAVDGNIGFGVESNERMLNATSERMLNATSERMLNATSERQLNMKRPNRLQSDLSDGGFDDPSKLRANSMTLTRARSFLGSASSDGSFNIRKLSDDNVPDDDDFEIALQNAFPRSEKRSDLGRGRGQASLIAPPSTPSGTASGLHAAQPFARRARMSISMVGEKLLGALRGGPTSAAANPISLHGGSAYPQSPNGATSATVVHFGSSSIPSIDENLAGGGAAHFPSSVLSEGIQFDTFLHSEFEDDEIGEAGVGGAAAAAGAGGGIPVPKQVVERKISLFFNMKSAAFRFTSSFLPEISKAIKDEETDVTLRFQDLRLSWTRNLSNELAENQTFRDFVLLNGRTMSVEVHGNGKSSKNSISWTVNGDTEDFILNVLTGVEPGSSSGDNPSNVRVFCEGQRSRVLVPLFAIDNTEFQDYVDSWVGALRLASEHAELMRIGDLERHGSFQLNKGVIEEDSGAASSLLALGLPTLAQQYFSLAGTDDVPPTTVANDMLLKRGIGAKGVWPDPFGEVVTPASGEETMEGAPKSLLRRNESSISSATQTNTATTPANVSNATTTTGSADKRDGTGPGVTKRASATSRVTEAAKAVLRERVVALMRLVATLRMHDIKFVVNPLESVSFTSELEHLTMALDRRSANTMSSMLYWGPSKLRLAKANSLNLTQALPSAWILGGMKTRKQSAVRLRHFAGLQRGGSVDMSNGFLNSVDSSIGSNDIRGGEDRPSQQAPHISRQAAASVSGAAPSYSATGNQYPSTMADLKITVLVEPIRHTFTPAIIQEFLVLQSSLSAEISLVLESAAKFSEERKKIPASSSRRHLNVSGGGEHLPTALSNYSIRFFSPGLAFRAKASRESKLPRIWSELDLRGLELSFTSGNAPLMPSSSTSTAVTVPSSGWLCSAKVHDLKVALFQSNSVNDNDNFALLKFVTNVDVTNVPLVMDVASEQYISITVNQTNVVVRPGSLDGFEKFQQPYITALHEYGLQRHGLEKVDLYAKKVWTNVTETSGGALDNVKRIFSGKIITHVFRFAMLDSSLMVLFVQRDEHVGALVSTMKKLEILGRNETEFVGFSPSANSPIVVQGLAPRLRDAELHRSRRRFSSGAIDFASSSSGGSSNFSASEMPAFDRLKGEAKEVHRFVVRTEISDISSSFVGKGATQLLSLRCIPKVVHEGAKCVMHFPTMYGSFNGESTQSEEMRVMAIFTISAPRLKSDLSLSKFLMGMTQTYLRTSPREFNILRATSDVSQWVGRVDEEEGVATGDDKGMGDKKLSFVSLEVNDNDNHEYSRVGGKSTRVSAPPVRMNPPLPPTRKFNVDFAFHLEMGAWDFCGETIDMSSRSFAASSFTAIPSNQVSSGGATQIKSFKMGRRRAMLQAQKKAVNPESVPGNPPFVSSAAAANTTNAGANNVPMPRDQRLFSFNLPRVDIGTMLQGEALLAVHQIRSHVRVETQPFTLFPVVLAFVQEFLWEIQATLVDPMASNVHRESRNSVNSLSSMGGGGGDCRHGHNRAASDASMLGIGKDNTGSDAVDVVVVVIFLPVSLNLKSSPDQPLCSLKMNLDRGAHLVYSNGRADWEPKLSLRSSSLIVPSVSLLLHELNPVFSANLNGCRIQFNRLLGGFADQDQPDRPMYTCCNIVESVSSSFNLWRIDDFFTLKRDWDVAWLHLMEERKWRNNFKAANNTGGSDSKSGRSNFSLISSTLSKPFETVDVEKTGGKAAVKKSIAEFDQYINLRRDVNGFEKSDAGVAAAVPANPVIPGNSVPFDVWPSSVTLFVSTRIRSAKVEARLGVLGTNVELGLKNVVARLTLPGQYSGLDREVDPDTLDITAEEVGAKSEGTLESSFSLRPGFVFAVTREKVQIPPPARPWQPWHLSKTTLNKTFFHTDHIDIALARVLAGEAKTKTHLFYCNLSKIDIQVLDKIVDGIVVLDSTLTCETCIVQVSADAVPILSESVEQLVEQVRRSQESNLNAVAAYDEANRRDWKFAFDEADDDEEIIFSKPALLRGNGKSALVVGGGDGTLKGNNVAKLGRQLSFNKSNGMAGVKKLGNVESNTLRALQAAGTIRVRVAMVDLSLIHDHSGSAWGTTIEYFGARLIVKKTIPNEAKSGSILRDLTIQTTRADVFRYFGHQWRNTPVTISNALGVARKARVDGIDAGSSDDDDDDNGPFGGSSLGLPTLARSISDGAISQNSNDGYSHSDPTLFSGTAIARTAKPISQVDAAKRTSAAHRAVTSRRGKKIIVSFPQSRIVMVTQQKLHFQSKVNAGGYLQLDSLVLFKFTSTFQEAISVSTDRREYSKLREMIGLLRMSSSVGPSTPTMSGDKAPMEARDFQLDGEDAFILEPQLNIMGEATHKVLQWFLEYLEWDRLDFARNINFAFTDSFEAVLANLLINTSRIDNGFNAFADLDSEVEPVRVPKAAGSAATLNPSEI